MKFIIAIILASFLIGCSEKPEPVVAESTFVLGKKTDSGSSEWTDITDLVRHWNDVEVLRIDKYKDGTARQFELMHIVNPTTRPTTLPGTN